MSIELALSSDTNEFLGFVEATAARSPGARVVDLGGGANPVLSPSFISSHDLGYLVVDRSESQLALVPESYDTQLADFARPGFALSDPADLVVTQWVLEHLSDPQAFHRMVYSSLKPGGRAIHMFPTLYNLPFTLNRVLPEALSERLLGRVQPARAVSGRQEKFPAHYRWCRGPTSRQLRRLRDVGFEIETYRGYFGHQYFNRVPALQRAEEKWSAFLCRIRATGLTSYAMVCLRKPG